MAVDEKLISLVGLDVALQLGVYHCVCAVQFLLWDDALCFGLFLTLAASNKCQISSF